MITLHFCVFWFILRGADFVRPSALTRGYSYMWMFAVGWCLLVVATTLEERYGIASGYLVVFYVIAIFFALVISLLEMFLLPTKTAYAEAAHGVHDTLRANEALPDSDQLIAPTQDGLPEESDGVTDSGAHPTVATTGDGQNEPEPTEESPLLGGGGSGSTDGTNEPRLTTFANYARRSLGGGGRYGSSGDVAGDQVDGQGRGYHRHFRRLSSMFIDSEHKPYGNEQAWSGRLPRWTWLVQFLIVGPFMLIIMGQAALLTVTAIDQTGPDGNSLVLPYLAVAAFSVFLLLPTTPTVHRFTHHIPVFLFLVFIGTLVYNLVAFPFSANNRYKAYFQQTVDLDTGSNEVIMAGLEQYIRPIIAAIPSAAGQKIECETRKTGRKVTYCTYTGIPPVVVPLDADVPPESQYKDWLSHNVTRQQGTNSATFEIKGKNTKACTIRFDRPVKAVHVQGAGHDDRFEAVPEGGSKEVKLWHRKWDEEWKVDVEWPVSQGKGMGDEGMEGRVVCLWSDNNEQDVIPALDEARRFVPEWVGISKLSDGLVEGSKRFTV